MPRRSDEFRAGCYYHLYNRGVNKERIFFDNENFAFFLRQMRHYFNDAVDVVAYCLMPNHYHLLAYLHTDDLVSVMQPFVMSFAKAINKRYERVGPLFQGRFASKLIDCDDYLLHLSRYIHLNPVVSGLAGKAEEWEYSSYPEYIGLRGGTLPSLSIAQPEGKSAARSENCHFLQLMIGSKTPLKAQFALFARSKPHLEPEGTTLSIRCAGTTAFFTTRKCSFSEVGCDLRSDCAIVRLDQKQCSDY